MLKKYAVFSGRARRKEYWMFLLFHIIIIIALGVIESIVGTNSVIALFYMLAILLPGLAVTVRRLHDSGKSGWWLLIGLVPLIGIVILVFMVQDGQAGDNQYGPNPKVTTAAA